MKRVLYLLFFLFVFCFLGLPKIFAEIRLDPAITNPKIIIEGETNEAVITIPLPPGEADPTSQWEVHVKCGGTKQPTPYTSVPPIDRDSDGTLDSLQFTIKNTPPPLGGLDCEFAADSNGPSTIPLEVYRTQSGTRVLYGKSSYSVIRKGMSTCTVTISGKNPDGSTATSFIAQETKLFASGIGKFNTPTVNITMKNMSFPSTTASSVPAPITFGRDKETFGPIDLGTAISNGRYFVDVMQTTTGRSGATSVICSASPFDVEGSAAMVTCTVDNGQPNKCSSPLCTYKVGLSLHTPPTCVLTASILNPTATPTPTPRSSPKITPPCTNPDVNGNCTRIQTAVGEIPADPTGFIKWLFGFILGMGGGIALILIIYSGYKLMVSRGDPEKTKGAKETFTSALVGLVFLIFSMVILQVISGTLLNIPGLGIPGTK